MLKKANAGVATLALAATLVAGSSFAATSSTTSTTAAKNKKTLKAKASAKTASLKSSAKAKARPASTTGTNTSSAPAAMNDTISASQAAPVSENVSVQTKAATTGSLRDKLQLTYTNSFYGPSISNIGNVNINNKDTGEALTGGGTLMRHRLYPGVKLGETTSAALGLEVRHSFGPNKVGGNRAQFRDPYLKLKDAKIINHGNFNLVSDFRVFAPVGMESADTSKITKLGTDHFASLQIKRLTLGVEGYADNAFFSNKASAIAKEQSSLYLYISPQASYQITPTVAATVLYEADAAHKIGGDTLFAAADLSSDAEVGVAWDITPSINLNPVLNLKTGNRLQLNTTTLNAYLSWKLL